MLWLMFYASNERFAIPSSRVDSVLPMVELHRAVHSHQGSAGVFSYRGCVTPVIDLAQWLFGNSQPLRLSSRIIMLRGMNGETIEVGVLADRVVELRAIEPGAGTELAGWTGVQSLGPVIADEHGMLQLLDVEQLIVAARRQSLLPMEAVRV